MAGRAVAFSLTFGYILATVVSLFVLARLARYTELYDTDMLCCRKRRVHWNLLYDLVQSDLSPDSVERDIYDELLGLVKSDR